MKLSHYLWDHLHKELLFVHQLEREREKEGVRERGRDRERREERRGLTSGQSLIPEPENLLQVMKAARSLAHPDSGMTLSVQYICLVTEDELETLSHLCAEDRVTQQREQLGGEGEEGVGSEGRGERGEISCTNRLTTLHTP